MTRRALDEHLAQCLALVVVSVAHDVLDGDNAGGQALSSKADDTCRLRIGRP
jgi:hypothetical protein